MDLQEVSDWLLVAHKENETDAHGGVSSGASQAYYQAWTRVNEALRNAKAERAVIEAAKALVHEQRHGTLASVATAEWAQADAVEALLAAEGE